MLLSDLAVAQQVSWRSSAPVSTAALGGGGRFTPALEMKKPGQFILGTASQGGWAEGGRLFETSTLSAALKGQSNCKRTLSARGPVALDSTKRGVRPHSTDLGKEPQAPAEKGKRKGSKMGRVGLLGAGPASGDHTLSFFTGPGACWAHKVP